MLQTQRVWKFLASLKGKLVTKPLNLHIKKTSCIWGHSTEKPSGIALVILSCMLFLFTSLTFLVALAKLYQVVERASGRAVASTQVWMVNDFSIFFLCFSVFTSGIIRASYGEIKGLCLRKMVALKFLDLMRIRATRRPRN